MDRTGNSKELDVKPKKSTWFRTLVLAALAAGVLASPAMARIEPGSAEEHDLRAYEQEVLARARAGNEGRRGADPNAIPNIFDNGFYLNVGNYAMKVMNYGYALGNPFTNLSSDPSGQWPGTSGIEYLNFVGIAIGAVNPFATDPNAVRRVSYVSEFRPPTLDPEDRMYRAYDGIISGQRFINDDTDLDPLTGDGRFDEDFLDGRDNDGDGSIDEDFAAIGQQMYSCVIRDDTPQAIASAAAERHVPLGVEVWQTAWAYSIPGFTDFNVANWKFINRSGHELDSVAIGFRTDMDCGPADKASYYSDDFDANQYPFGRFVVQTRDTDRRLQPKGSTPVESDSALCSRYTVTIHGFSIADDDGDEFKTPGVPYFQLIDHTIDPLGLNGPRKVGFRAFRSFPSGQPYVSGGNPTIDQQRFEFMTGTDNIAADPNTPALTGFINQASGDQKSDYSSWASVGPWLHWQNNEMIEVTIAVGIATGDLKTALAYPTDYQVAAINLGQDPVTQEDIYGVTDGSNLLAKYPSLVTALAAQVAFEGAYEERSDWPLRTDYPGRETGVKAPPGQTLQLQGCESRDPVARFVTDRRYEWFDFDCDYCTGAYSNTAGGLFHRTWLAESPPPNPSTNLGVSYNYTLNSDRRFPPAGDRAVNLAWDNLSENIPDPKTGSFDFRGYRVWKVSDWRRPVGSAGPAENDWTLLAEFRMFECGTDTSCQRITRQRNPYCRTLYVPALDAPQTVCLNPGDLYNLQSGEVIRPDTANVKCVGWPGTCVVDSGLKLGSTAKIGRVRYPVGIYRFTDNQVKNGFTYFYSVTAFDSTGFAGTKVELAGRRSAIEAEGIVPQSGTSATGTIRVVPNPYRGVRDISARPSGWDLIPNGTDPTGTHIDFFGLPSGPWTIKIFTLSGDLVATLNWNDAINASLRTASVQDSQGNTNPNVTLQQDTANDGQARWNLISRNGQDVVSGIYLFACESSRGTERGKFVIIR